MGLFPSSYENKYVLVMVDYVNKMVEAIVLPTNENKHVLKISVQNIIERFGCPHAIISDGGLHFCNKLFANLMDKYSVTHKMASAYHPQTSC